jgi:hypothetical protein
LSRPRPECGSSLELGEAKININYAYAGVEPRTNAPLCFSLASKKVGRATNFLTKSLVPQQGRETSPTPLARTQE